MIDSNLSLFRNIIDKMGKFNWISVINLADSYHQFSIKSKDQHKLTFTIDSKRSIFVVAPFEIKVMTGILQKTIEKLLADLEIPPFLDNIVVASATEEYHIKLVKEVLKRLIYDAGLRINLKKSKFFKQEAKILGMVVSKTEVQMDPMKVETINNWLQPIDKKRIQKFMGAANFHRNFSHISDQNFSTDVQAVVMKEFNFRMNKVQYIL
jgi:hypothetical protein